MKNRIIERGNRPRPLQSHREWIRGYPASLMTKRTERSGYIRGGGGGPNGGLRPPRRRSPSAGRPRPDMPDMGIPARVPDEVGGSPVTDKWARR